jgi:arylsulfatase A-like enzyme
MRVVVLQVVVLIIVGALLPGIRREEPEVAAATLDARRPPNIIFIVVDALRADHLSSYGYASKVAPNLENRLASVGVLFTEATAVSSWTNPSNGALLTGRLPSDIDTVWSDENRRIPESETLLAEYLQSNGYITAGFVSNWWLSARFGYDQGFDYYVQTEGDDRERAAAVNELAQTWLDANCVSFERSGKPLFLFLYYFDPHSWYDPPSPFDTRFDPDYAGFLTPEIFGHGHDVVSGKITLSERDLAHLLALYDGEIAYWDQQFGLMMDDLERRDLLENSLIVLTSDHGQMFGEHGKWVHRNSLYEEVLRVPLLFRYREVLPQEKVLNEAVDHLDVTPTLLEFAGIDPPEHMRGRSLVPLMKGERPLDGRPIYAEMAGETDPAGDAYWIVPRSNLYAIKEDGHKLIHVQQAPHLDRLYKVEGSSIYEGENLIDADPDRARSMWLNLQDQFTVPTEFLYLPVLQRP